MQDESDFPYYDDTIVFSDNIPEALKTRLALLKDAWRRKDLLEFMRFADNLEPLMKNSYFMHSISKDELEKFYVMLGRDWWNRSERVKKLRAERKNRCLACFPARQ